MDIGNVMFSPTVAKRTDRERRHRRLALTNLPTSGTTIGDTPHDLERHERRHRKPGRQRNHRAAGRHPVLASWDRPFFDITNLNPYPTTYGPVNSSDRRGLVG